MWISVVRANRAAVVLKTLGVIVIGLSSALADESQTPALDSLRGWLVAYNAGDTDSLKNFEEHYLGNSDIAFAQDSREETGGFELVIVETSEPLKLSALLRERDSPVLWRVELERASADSDKLLRLNYRPLPQTQKQALTSLNAFGSRLTGRNKFSGVVVVEKQGKRLFGKAWGMADRAANIPVTLRTQFYFASQGKMFTAVSILQLVEQGRVSLDDPVGKYLTDYPNAEVAQKVTIRDLLTHSGGTGEMGILQPQDSNNRAWVRSIADIIKLNGARAPAFEPGTKYEYSNYGFVLLGAVIEKVSGQSYYDYVQQHIFRPAGMHHTGYPLREQVKGIAVTYTEFDGPLRPSADELPWRGTPAGGGVSTATDMLSFVTALNSGKLLSPAMLVEATSKHMHSYGYGFISSGYENLPYWGHGGGARGMSLVLDYYPTTKTSFVCMSNRDPPICDRLAFNYLFRSPRKP
jgi:D-alanyl-D-alanine carboxypeptidase